ncbi:MAG: hypothetical protein AB8B55_09420 [Mariniblastus sp.]
MSAKKLILTVVFLTLFPLTLLAGGGPENVLVVVNADSASSKMLANYYIAGRNIPPQNVVYLNGIPDKELVDMGFFRDKVLKPLIKEIETRKLAASIDYIVYSSDFPTAISNHSHLNRLKKKIAASGSKEPPWQLFHPNVSINAATYFAAAFITNDPGYMGMTANNYYRQPASVLLRQPFIGETKEQFDSAIAKFSSDSKGELKAAVQTLIELATENPQQAALHYWLARFYGKLGDAKNATLWITRAARAGWCYRTQTLADLAFDDVKDDALFSGIVDRIPDQAFDFAPTHGFSGRYAWGPNGMINKEAGQGNRHFISTVLGVTRNQGNTEREALRQLQASMRADETKPDGTFYFTETGDVRTKTRVPNFQVAIDALTEMGMRTKIVKATMPSNVDDVVGLTCGSAKFDWAKTKSRIVPGAICDNLTSLGGCLHNPSQTKLNEFLRYGAAGASGTVVEPYAVQPKFPHPMIHAHYARGCSLGEAFYQSVHGPFQLLIVGDALCQPWATKPVLKVGGMSAGATIKGRLKILLDASDSPVSIAGLTMFVDGIPVHRTKMVDTIPFDTRGMTDGYHEIRFVAVANNPIETTGTTIVPVIINNKNISTQLETQFTTVNVTDQVTFTAKSNYGDSIELMHNGRAIAKEAGREAKFKIPAALLGRGPVKVEAVAVSSSGKGVASIPISMMIEGKILAIKQPPKKTPKKKPATQKTK